MVDTINPDTNQPDAPADSQAPVSPTVPENRFYGGFDKPDETKINLADGETPAPVEPSVAPQPAPVTPEPQPQAPQKPIHDMAPVAPKETKHTSYVNTTNMINWRGIIVIALIGLVVALVLGAGLYFGLSAMNNAKIKEQEAKLDELNSELVTLEESPNPLELPESETPSTEETPVVAPVTTPTETPVTAPSTLPASTTDGTTAAG